MFCKHCGAEIPNDVLFCVECGRKQESGVSSGVKETENTRPVAAGTQSVNKSQPSHVSYDESMDTARQQERETENRKQTRNAWIAVGVIFVILVIINLIEKM